MNGWYSEGPFGIWHHPDGSTIVNTEPGYVLTRNGKELRFNDLSLAMSYGVKIDRASLKEIKSASGYSRVGLGNV